MTEWSDAAEAPGARYTEKVCCLVEVLDPFEVAAHLLELYCQNTTAANNYPYRAVNDEFFSWLHGRIVAAGELDSTQKPPAEEEQRGNKVA